MTESQERSAGIRLADEVRALLVDLHTLDPTAEVLGEAADRVAAVRDSLGDVVRWRWYEVPADEVDEDDEARLRVEYRDHSLFRGGRSPLAPPLAVTTGGDDADKPIVVGEVRVDRCHEGPPGRIHGGYVAGLFDDVLSGTLGLVDAGQAFTARLQIRYRKPTPIDVDLRFEAWVERHSGRRLIARARCLAGGEVTAEAEALFVTVSRDQESLQGTDTT
ncbi:MAG: PaaI family thioesterase [Acidimicrobiales bacterium]|jgi:acyl-coenzyme A thioesterase PaaI-like protein|nr:PaaI family thioesterase [Acidimicrobiales bacterium]|tara:strand:+ start:1267 stop:1923 length:657 start_codon:yes stop_codon:yes gene_type:complete